MEFLVLIIIVLGLFALFLAGKIPGIRPKLEADQLPMRKRIFFIIVSCVMFAFYFGATLAAFLWEKILPYVVFGPTRVREEHITIAVNLHNSITFSNGVALHRFGFVASQLLWGFLALIFIIFLFVFLLRTTAWIITAFKPALGEEILNGFKAMMKSPEK